MSGAVRAAAAIAAVAALSRLNILGNGFALDDFGLIARNQAVQHFDWRFLLGSDYWAGFDGRSSGLYRPLTSLAFALQWALGGGAPALFHGASLVLHVLCALLGWDLLRRLGAARTALFAALLFAAHPAPSEAVAAIAGQADLLAALCGLAALRAAVAARQRGGGWGWNAAAAAALFLALLAKEQAVVLPALLALLDWRRGRQRAPAAHLWRPYVLWLGVVALYLLLRRQVLGGTWGIGYIEPLDNPLAALPPSLRLLNAAPVLWRYIGLLVLPQPLSADYSYGALPVYVQPLSPALPAAALLLLAAALLLHHYGRRPRLDALGALWALAALAPVAHIALPIGTMLAERLLYLPSLGFCLLPAAALARVRQPGRGAVLAAALVALLAVHTWGRNRDWRDNETLFAAAVAAYPHSARAHAGLGQALLERGDYIGALQALRRAWTIYPPYAEAHYNAGVAYLRLHQWEEALAALERAAVLEPRDARTALNRGVALWELGRWEEALAAYEEALALAPGYAAARENLARARAALNASPARPAPGD